MALNIPVNLMNATASVSQPTTTTETIDMTQTVQPASAGTGARNAASGGGGGYATADDSLPSKTFFAKRAGTVTPDKAEPKSVVTAQTASTDKPTLPQTSQATQSDPPVSELDRYAPPDPLPTAPILQAASNYAAKRTGA